MKICEKDGCENKIPWIHGGRKVNVQRRRFCFECSPFGSRNTKDLNVKKEDAVKAVYNFRKKRKEKCIEYKGGECIICGYKACNAALEFHHLNPEEKDFQISSSNCKSWEKTKNELDKCVLLCCRCHREVHDGITQLPNNLGNIKDVGLEAATI